MLKNMVIGFIELVEILLALIFLFLMAIMMYLSLLGIINTNFPLAMLFIGMWFTALLLYRFSVDKRRALEKIFRFTSDVLFCMIMTIILVIFLRVL